MIRPAPDPDAWFREHGHDPTEPAGSGRGRANGQGGAAKGTAETRRTEAPAITSAAELMGKPMPPLRWAVREIVPAGYTVFAGPPKLGKSWLVLQTGAAVAGGGLLFGQDCEQADVLLLALEDGERRLQERLGKVLDGKPAPSGLKVATSWPRLDQGGLEAIERWAEGKPGALVLIDTLARVRPPSQRGVNAYEGDYTLHGRLHALAHGAGIALVAVTHTRQGNSADFVEAVTGSSGITGAADSLLVLKRQRGEADGFLSTTGRDVREQELALKSDNGLWRCLGDAKHVLAADTRRTILAALATAGTRGLKPAEIAEASGLKRDLVRQTVRRMAEAGQLRALEGGRYAGAGA